MSRTGVRAQRPRAKPAPAPRPRATPVPLIGLQRAAGNRAVCALVQRAPVLDAKGVLVKVRFTVGTDIDSMFAQTAKGVISGGVIDDGGLLALQAAAVGARETFSDDEQQFAAALLDSKNDATLRRASFSNAGDVVEFPASSITAARRARVADLGRPKVSGSVIAEEKAAAKP
jgi:hypothetical protein